jgi:hypothetical protein
MDMPYKRNLGAKPVSRLQFLSLLADARDAAPQPFDAEQRNAKFVIDEKA